MKKLTMLVEFEYDENMMHGGDDDAKAKEWFFDLLTSEELRLISDEIGDDIGTVKVLSIETAVKSEP